MHLTSMTRAVRGLIARPHGAAVEPVLLRVGEQLGIDKGRAAIGAMGPTLSFDAGTPAARLSLVDAAGERLVTLRAGDAFDIGSGSWRLNSIDSDGGVLLQRLT